MTVFMRKLIILKINLLVVAGAVSQVSAKQKRGRKQKPMWPGYKRE